MKTLVLVTGTEASARALTNQLRGYLEDGVSIQTHWLDGEGPGILRGPVPLSEETVLVLSSELVHQELRTLGWLPAPPALVARRTVDPESIERIVGLPLGTKILFVNDHPESARECIEALLDLGLDGFDWVPWYPGAPEPPADRTLVVTAGEAGLVPVGPWPVVDIGVRILDFGTLAELFGLLQLPPKAVGRSSRRYLSTILRLANHLVHSTEEARRVSRQLGSVLDSLGNGILVYDLKGRVLVCNDEFRSLLQVRAGRAETLGALIKNRELLEFLECRCGEDSGLFRLAEGSVLVKRFDLEQGGHTVAAFQDGSDQGEGATRLAQEYRKRGHVAKWTLTDLVGESPGFLRAKGVAARLAAADLTILLHGETGTGKELFASAIHAASPRASGPFLAVDLGSLSDDLIESELFGHEEGSFTGARKGGKPGLFELADRGTLFLDEIGNISMKVQKRLLRVLQEKEVMRVGGTAIQRVDVRVIAATHEDLRGRISRGEFREDLYFRLKMGWLRIPPLRERIEDIPLLVAKFLAVEGAGGITLTPGVLAALADREWPGNVRELRNTLAYMLAVREGSVITLRELPEETEPPAALPAEADLASPREGDRTDHAILAVLADLEASGLKAGRQVISERCQKQGLALGEGAVRGRLERLADRGWVISHRGPAGTKLTPEGRSQLVQSPMVKWLH